ncbi:terminase small subunit [Skermanella rosea]|uniref:terminase small subunit n=1 Tax=Skermanella rosea TaxID=1817965 RepID=UPI0019323404|nr:terminase small subunit [Skermanella rosea]UEM04376.1 terminase small subunit [Skermanella rosea]
MTQLAASPPAIRLGHRQELFCQAMAAGTAAAEAARRAGYSSKGAKQRGHFLMTQPEIRVRIDRIRAGRRAMHQAELDRAAGLVDTIIADAMEKGRSALALRAIQFRLKLLGVIQDRRIAHHFHDHRFSPDADVETLAPDPAEWMDGIDSAPEPTPTPAPQDAAAPDTAVTDAAVTDDDLSPPADSDPDCLPAGFVEALKAELPPDILAGFLDGIPADLLDDLPEEIAGLSWAELASRLRGFSGMPAPSGGDRHGHW